MNATVAQLTAYNLLRRWRAGTLLGLSAVPLLLSVLICFMAGPDVHTAQTVLEMIALGTVVPLLALIAGTGVIGPEIDDGSIIYLLAKPVPRGRILRSKLAVASVTVAVLAAVPTFVTGLLLAPETGGLAVGYAVGAALAGVTYCALFLMLSVLTRHAVVVGLAYALLWESLVGGFVSGARALSVRQWASAVTGWIVGDGAEGLRVTSEVSPGAAIPLLLVTGIGCTWYAGHRLRGIRVTADE